MQPCSTHKFAQASRGNSRLPKSAPRATKTGVHTPLAKRASVLLGIGELGAIALQSRVCAAL